MNVTLLQFDYSSSNGISGDRERLEKLSIFAILNFAKNVMSWNCLLCWWALSSRHNGWVCWWHVWPLINHQPLRIKAVELDNTKRMNSLCQSVGLDLRGHSTSFQPVVLTWPWQICLIFCTCELKHIWWGRAKFQLLVINIWQVMAYWTT